MGKIKPRLPIKLIAGFIYSDERRVQDAQKHLRKRFGKIDFQSPILSFSHTNYYEAELDRVLRRKFISFAHLIPAQSLPAIKIFTNRLEQKFCARGKRTINIDPGYLDLAKLVLATTKDYKHRIYLDQGIFAEATLIFQNKTFQPWVWTYPDYKTKEYIDIFNKIREAYAFQIKNI
ncbi:MAG: DUF4416 family protein [Candidatus Omnitrophota bacterium]